MIAIALAVAGAIVEARQLAGPDPSTPILFALALPVALVALELGLVGGLVAATAAMAAVVVWAADAEPAFTVLDYVARGAVIAGGAVFTAMLSGRADAADKSRREALRELVLRRREGDELRKEVDQLTAIADAGKEMIRGAGAQESRLAICQAVRAAVDAPIVVLYEPGESGRELRATAASGVKIDGESIALEAGGPNDATGMGVVTAYTIGDVVHADDPHAQPIAILPALTLAGVRRSYWQPVGNRSHVVGVIEIGWTDRDEDLDPGLAEVLARLAVEAEMALERARGIAKLESLAVTDPLTGLGNRRAWEDQLGRDLARALRDDAPVCVAILDLDEFKDFNDRHGHQAGDRLLRSTVARWEEAIRTGDFLARWGGDEFALIMPGGTPLEARGLIDRLRAAAPESPFSAGIAAWDGTESPETLIRRADSGLYRAKQAGRGRTQVAPHDAVFGVHEEVDR